MTRARFVLLLAFVGVVIGGIGIPEAAADPYFNSSEPGCDPANRNPNYVLCDDFDDGNWAVTCNDPNNANNDGWLLCNSVGQRTPPPPAATCGGAGAGGTNCTA